MRRVADARQNSGHRRASLGVQVREGSCFGFLDEGAKADDFPVLALAAMIVAVVVAVCI